MRAYRRIFVVAFPTLALITGCAAPAASQPAPSAAVPASPPVTAAADQCVPWGCVQQGRLSAASAFIAAQKGHIGIVVRDRISGSVWRGGEPDLRIWASSTPKLALTVALKEDARAGKFKLTAAQNTDIDRVLAVSDNNAADRLWDFYHDSAGLMKRFQTQYGMVTADYADYVGGSPDRWGFIKCSAQDLEHLISYVLEKLNADDRAFIMSRMRSVGPPQQWGVWGAGAANMPGVKDGWSSEEDGGVMHYVTSTVGFAGPDARYTVAAMYYQLPGGDTKEKGVHVLTDLVATVFGAPVPAPAVIPQDD